MKNVVSVVGILLACTLPCLRAGSVIPLGNSATLEGKVSFVDAFTLQVDGSNTKIGLPDVLVAYIGDPPPHLDAFSSTANPAGPLPATWKGQDILPVDAPGKYSYANGVFTLTGCGLDKPKNSDDHAYFIGQPWTGDGQWTIRVSDLGTPPQQIVGLMLRDSLDADSVAFALGAGPLGGTVLTRADAGRYMRADSVPLDIPTWLRLRRDGISLQAAVSTDGVAWDVVGQNHVKLGATPWVGLFAISRLDKGTGNALVDNVTFTTAGAPADTLFSGILLRSGSLVAGTYRTADDENGRLTRNTTQIPLPKAQISAVIFHPVPHQQIADNGAQVGLLLKNGDFMTGDIQDITDTSARLSSLLLGISTYSESAVNACILQPLQLQAAEYEVRLFDGSVIRAAGFADSSETQITIDEVSGLNIVVAPADIAQIRSGSAHVQALADLPWKATPAPAPTPVPAPTTAPATPAPANAPAPTAPAAITPTNPNAGVQTWIGSRREQILSLPTGVSVEFPLPGKFKALAVSVALAPDAPPTAQATIRMLIDGREVGRSPPFRAGESPRFVELTLADPAAVTIEADSFNAGTKVLLIDPVAIRD